MITNKQAMYYILNNMGYGIFDINEYMNNFYNKLISLDKNVICFKKIYDNNY